MNVVESLPAFNAAMNAIGSLLLVAGWLAIRGGRRQLHRALMLAALTASAVFLVGYLTRMGLAGSQRFPEIGLVKTVYLAVLLPHSLLAAVNLPLILRTLYLAWRQRFDAHRRIARIAWPVWMFVNITGVLVYWMLYHLAPTLSGGTS